MAKPSDNNINSIDYYDHITPELLLAESFFSPYVCHFCKKPRDLKSCKRCKLVSYCCKDHQKHNWPAHRNLCNAVSKVVKRFNSKSIFDNGSKSQSWGAVRSWAMYLAEDELKEELTPIEREMFWYPDACAFCRSFKTDKKLVCQSCLFVSYCSPSHKKQHHSQHLTICSELKFSSDLSMFMVNQSFNAINLELITNLNSYTLPDNMANFIDRFVNIVGSNYMQAIASEKLTCIATIIYSITRLCISHLNNLSIFILGAEIGGPESDIMKYAELLFHFFPSVDDISLYFIGPNNFIPCYIPDMCSNCSSKSLHLFSITQLYHDYVSTSNYFDPDFIFAFNCGLHANEDSIHDSWSPTIPMLYNSKLLTVFTSYSKEEASKDFNRFIKFKPSDKQIQILEQCKKNKYCTLWPHRDWESNRVFYSNYYISIIKNQLIM